MIASLELARTADNLILMDLFHHDNSEVLLLSFLPGLVANDAIRLDAYLFEAAFWQCL